MEKNFIITGIDRVIYVDRKEYAQRISKFSGTLHRNELIYHFNGEATVYFGKEVLHTKPDTVRFLPEGEWGLYRVERILPGDCIDIFFHTDRPVAPAAFMLEPGNQRLAPLFKKLFALWVSRSEGYYFACISLLYRIFAELQKQTYLPEKQYEQIRPAINYIHEHFLTEKITADRLAAVCGISYSYVKRLFAARFGVTPKRYVIQLRMNYACELLLSGLYNVSAVAEQCGYEDVNFFSRQFKEHMGISPRQFLMKYRSSK